MNKLNAIVVDDDKSTSELIKIILKRDYPEIELVGSAYCVEDGLTLLHQVNVNILFLDIEMPDGTGFDLLLRLANKNFHVIFVTAFNDYAIQAFKVNAIDYVTKPIDIDELKSAIDKAKRIINDDLLQNLNLNEVVSKLINSSKKIAFQVGSGVEYINADDILYIEADGNYSTIHLRDKNMVVIKQLKYIEQQLEQHYFFRSHRSTIINLRHIISYNLNKEEDIVLSNGAKLFISRNKRDEFLVAMNRVVS